MRRANAIAAEARMCLAVALMLGGLARAGAGATCPALPPAPSDVQRFWLEAATYNATQVRKECLCVSTG